MRLKGILCLAFMAGLALSAPTNAWADDCDDKIVDAAGKLTPGDRAAVNAAAQNLGNLGTDVRIRTVMNHGEYENLDMYEDAVRRSCRSWKGPDGLTKNNLVVFIFSYGDKRGAGLYYGRAWNDRLRDKWPEVVGSVRPLLKDGRNGQAFVTAIDGVAGYLRPTPVPTAYVPPAPAMAPAVPVSVAPAERPAPAPPASRAPPATNSPPTVTNGSKPTNLTGLWVVLGILVIAGASIAAYFVTRSRKREEERRRAAQQAAAAVKVECANRINDFDSGTKLALIESRVNTAAEEACEEDAQALRTSYGALKASLDSAKLAFAALQNSRNDPSHDEYSAETYGRIEASYRALLDQLGAFEQGIPEIDDQIAALKRLAGEVPAKIAEARQAIAQADQAREKISSQQYAITDSDVRMGEAKASFVEAETAQTQKRFADAKASAEKAGVQAKEAAALAAAVPVRRKTAIDGAAAQKARIADIEAGIASARDVFDQLAVGYAPACWETVDGNADSAAGEVAAAKKAVEDAVREADMDRQDWNGADESVGMAKASLDRAASLTRSVMALKTSLETIRRDAPGEIEAARKSLKEARAFILQHDDDIRESLETDLDAIEVHLNGFPDALAADKPDYLGIIAKTKAAHAAVDKIFGEAREEHSAMERKRQQAASEVRDAKVAISMVEEYVEDHAGDVGGSASTKLASARRALENAQDTANLDEIIRYAGESETAAKAALETAKEAVRRAEAERAAERARIEAERQRRLEEERRAEEARRRRIEEERRAEQARRDRIEQDRRAEQARRDREDADRRAREATFSSTPFGGGGSSSSGSNGGGGSISFDSDSSSSSPPSSNNGGGGSTDW